MKLDRLGTMLDCAQSAIMRPDVVCRWAKLTKELGYNTLLLYLEDVIELEGHPYFGYGRGRYSRAELKEIDAYCSSIGVEVIPCIQTLAHLGCITRWPAFKPMIDVDNILLVDDERTYALIEDMFRTMAQCFTGRTINIGMDEAHLVGHGKYYDLHGDTNHAELLLRHLERVAEIGKRYGYTLLMWSDMFFRLASGGKYYAPNAELDSAAAARIPENVELVYWDYYSTSTARYDAMLQAHKALKPGTWFAGGLWSWRGLAPHNRYSIETTQAALTACEKHGVRNIVMTLWGDDGTACSYFSLLPSLYAAAQMAQGVTDMGAIRAGFTEKFGVSFDDFMLLDLPGTGNDFGRSGADKYLLFNDPFTGLYDSTLRGGESEAYHALAEKLSQVKSGVYQAQFAVVTALARVLELKAELGRRTRAAYSAGDRDALEAVTADYDALLPRLEALYDAVRTQWLQENKPQGFEIQDVRFGGLMLRIKDCAAMLRDYLGGKIGKIDALEQPLLDYEGGETFSEKPFNGFPHWSKTVTTGYMETP